MGLDLLVGGQVGRESQRHRSVEEQENYREIKEYVGRPNPLGFGGGRKAVCPPAVGAALGKGAEEGGGLHNIAASLQMPSPEYEGLPTTELRAPVFSKMTNEQKRAFLALCGVELWRRRAVAAPGAAPRRGEAVHRRQRPQEACSELSGDAA